MNYYQIKITVGIICCILFCFWATAVSAQKEQILFDAYTVDDGLSQNSINTIFKDSRGFIWIGTEDGLNQYDGVAFKTYRPDIKNRYSIASNYIYEIMELPSGDLLLGTEKGLSVFRYHQQQFDNYYLNADEEICVRALLMDKKGNIWIGTRNKGLFRFNIKNQTLIHFNADIKFRSQMQCSQVFDIIQDSLNNIWIATDKGVFLYEENTYSFNTLLLSLADNIALEAYSLHSFTKNLMLIGTNKGYYAYDIKMRQSKQHIFDHPLRNNIRAMTSDNKNKLWLATDKGLILFNNTTLRYEVFMNDINAPFSLRQNIVLALLYDDQNILWVGTEAGGLNVYNKNARKFKTFNTVASTSSAIGRNIIYGFAEDKDGKIWVATYGRGIDIIDLKNNSFENIHANPVNAKGLQSNNIYCLVADRENNIWIGTRDAGLQIYNQNTKHFYQYLNNPDDKQSLSHNAVKTICITRDNKVWIGTYGGGINTFNRKTKTFKRYLHSPLNPNSIGNNIIYFLYEDKEGILWAGTRGGGLNKYVAEKDGFIRYLHQKNDSNSISDNLVYPICIDRNNNFWIGTMGGGLNLFDREKEQFQHFTTSNGLSNNIIYSILEDIHGNIWMSTASGISSFDTDKKKFKNFYTTDGLQSNEFNGGAGYTNSKGYLFFGGINGFNYFHPDSIFYNTTAPQVYISNFQVLHKPYILKESDIANSEKSNAISLSYKENILTFEFVALNFTHPEANQYACIMEGFEKDWNYLGTRKIMNYTNLNPGRYTFRVKACNNDGYWNEQGASLELIIQPPFYKTWLFRIFIIIIILTAIIFIVKRREYQLKTDKLKLAKAVEERTYEIKMQNEEIITQRDEIISQRNIIEKKNVDITSSIQYAKKIQRAILPDEKEIYNMFADFFILYLPKDIVSGDFYWFKKNENIINVAAVDCTGHGVPGAFMSFVASNMLNNIFKQNTNITPAQILNQLNNTIQKFLRPVSDNYSINDSLDIALVQINKAKQEILFAGAINDFYLLRDGKLEKIAGEEYYIGQPFNDDFTGFADKKINFQANEAIYLFSDGFADQFGGKNNRKYSTKRLIEFLTTHSSQPFQIQKEKLLNEFNLWKQYHEQTDDVMIIGLKL